MFLRRTARARGRWRESWAETAPSRENLDHSTTNTLHIKPQDLRDWKPPRLALHYASCTVSKSFLARYRGDVAFTPNIERWARDARTFENHVTEAGSSGVAYAALFSGVQADRHGVFRHPQACRTMCP